VSVAKYLRKRIFSGDIADALSNLADLTKADLGLISKREGARYLEWLANDIEGGLRANPTSSETRVGVKKKSQMLRGAAALLRAFIVDDSVPPGPEEEPGEEQEEEPDDGEERNPFGVGS